jgi:hypothetical protein
MTLRYIVLALTLSTSMIEGADAQPLATTLDLACRDDMSPHACALAVRDAVKTARSPDAIYGATQYWSDRFDRDIIKLRSSSVGLVRARSDWDQIKQTIADELQTGTAQELARHAPVPQSWRDSWRSFWLRYLGRVSVFLNSPAAKFIEAALKPSQVATTYDELLLSNKGVDDAVYARMQQLSPAPSLIETVRDGAYSRAAARWNSANPEPPISITVD